MVPLDGEDGSYKTLSGPLLSDFLFFFLNNYTPMLYLI